MQAVELAGRTLYHFHSLGAAGGAGFDRLTGWLDHVVGMGCGGVLLTPVFESSDHGYDTIDPMRVDDRLGGDAAFDRFVAACHARDLAVILDGVFNHVGRAFPRFVDRDPDWFRWNEDGSYRCFEGHLELPSLNHRNPAVLDWAAAVTNHWLARGADGWRLDAAYAIPRPFLAALSARVDAFMFGEMIHGDYRAFIEESGLASVTQYEWYKAIWSSLNDGNFFELAWALKRHPGILPVTFVGNHDVTRLASQLTDTRHIARAAAILLTLPGIPCLYYGDEFGWQGVKEHRAGGDDAIRPPIPPAPPADGPDTEGWRRLIHLRRRHPTPAAVEVLEVANRRISVACGVLRCDIDLDATPGWSVTEQ